MLIIETIAVAFGMFSSIPVPQPEWNDRNLRYALCAFPLVGVVIAFSWVLWAWISTRMGLPDILKGAGLCLLPVIITGGIHLDGYADTCDALACHGSIEKRQEILRDSRCGAFAAIRLCMLFTASFALCCSLHTDRVSLICTGLIFVMSRTLSGLAIVSFPLAKKTGLAYTFASAVDGKRVRYILTAAALAQSVLICVICAGAAAKGLNVPAVSAAADNSALLIASDSAGNVSAGFAADACSVKAAGLDIVPAASDDFKVKGSIPVAAALAGSAETAAGGANHILTTAFSVFPVLPGLLTVLTGWAMFAWYRYTAVRKFGGLSGDLAGWFLQKAECWMLAVWVLGQYTR